MSSLTFFLFFGLVFFSFARAATVPDILINEIAWMGTQNSANDEWIELYNNTPSPINLDGWVLKATDGTPEIKLAGVIPASGFYLLERTDDNAALNVSADQIYTGALNNGGEVLELFNNRGILIDSAVCGEGWLAGDNTAKQTMERNDFQSWQTSQTSGGTPKAQNSARAQESSLKEKEVDEEPAENSIIVYPVNIVINEVLPSPLGPDDEEEWIELLNRNNFIIGLEEWQIIDASGKTTPYMFPKGTTMEPQGFLVLNRPTSKIVLNNGGDGLKLLQPDGEAADAVNYETAPQGESFNRFGSDWAWSSSLTPGAPNIAPATKPAAEANEVLELPEKALAAVGPQAAQLSPVPFIGALAALFLAIFSGIAVLVLKKALK